ncbi:MAG TPA: Gfo/Idh/MocA family oxidoreductase [Chloroflexota bacterium]|nr:Gfo/Idh/MocA family oxidoreductase [Chloroflexota bacterium]
MATRIRLGLAGLGNEGRQIAPYFAREETVELTAVADVRAEAREAFRHDFPSVRAFESVEAMCRSGAVDAVWIATPNPFHAEHTICAAENGVHVILEKPMAITLDQAEAMVEAAERSRIRLLLHSHASDAPVVKMREIVASGRLGRLIGIHAWSYKGWLRSPRLPAELDTSMGGGVVFRQGPHQIEIVRRIGGGMVRSVRAYAGRWHSSFQTEGDYTALLEFENGAPATLVFNGYGYFNITDLTWGVGESGFASSAGYRRQVRQTAPADPATFYTKPRLERPRPDRERRQPIFGLTVVSCEYGDLRQSPDGIYVYTDDGCEEIICPPYRDRAGDLRAMAQAIAGGTSVFPDGRWGLATLEVILGILQSSREGRTITLAHQCPAPE